MDTIAERCDAVRERIAKAARRVNRTPEEVTLIAVTKTHSARLVAQAIAAGVIDLGENRVQEAVEKIELLAAERARVRWHMIGHLQRNKARQALAFDCVHSVDSLRLAETLDRQVDQQSLLGQRRLPILLELNVSGEASKEGFDLPGGIDNRTQLPLFFQTVERMLALPRLDIQGVMTVAPFTSEPEAARPTFRALSVLRDTLAQRFPSASWEHLSMGMTGDFEVAIEEGATLVRVGRAIFGAREQGM